MATAGTLFCLSFAYVNRRLWESQIDSLLNAFFPSNGDSGLDTGDVALAEGEQR
ncbi:hypothetical protein [Candidatus Poriferisocius sp.]|uniref:hypothetical protein n=1 Tax=Candidatus Poriferisocius sp. TaxID=3101276 RepID=UPI003B0102F5